MMLVVPNTVKDKGILSGGRRNVLSVGNHPQRYAVSAGGIHHGAVGDDEPFGEAVIEKAPVLAHPFALFRVHCRQKISTRWEVFA